MRISHDVDTSTWPQLWQAAYRILETTLVPNQLRAWIQPLVFIQIDQTSADKLTVNFSAPNTFSANWVRDHFRGPIEQAFSQVTGKKCSLSCISHEKPEEGNEAATEDASSASSGATDTPVGHLLNFGTTTSSVSSENVFQGNAPYSNSILGATAPSSYSSEQSTSSFSGDRILENQGHFREEPLVPNPTVSVSQMTGKASQELVLNPNYTFENFIVGSSNQFAHASAAAVADLPARKYNPLFIYSAPGLGKTHLLHAVGNQVLKRNPKARVAYLSAEAFANELIDSIQHKRPSYFRTKYRDSFDLLLIDDIQFIAGKSSTEEEFFHTFNTLHGSGRQIVITSDKPPKDIPKLEERIRTRFEWGLVVDIQPPEIETRIAILKAKAERDDLYLPDEAAVFLATYVKNNMRELEGILVKLQAQSSLSGAEISLEMAKSLLKNQVPEETSNYTAELIQTAVTRYFQIKLIDLKTSSRARSVAFPRQVAMYLIRKYTGMGFREIGSYFGGKDHTTVMHACTKIEENIDTDNDLRTVVEGIQNTL